MPDIVEHPELDEVLDATRAMRADRFRHAPWLLCGFDSPVWNCRFTGGKEVIVDFRIPMMDGRSLTSSNHNDLLRSLKSWLVSQSDSALNRKSFVGEAVIERRVLNALTLIDYLLVNQNSIQICDYGLAALTGSDLRRLLSAISSSKSLSDWCYRWPERLAHFLRQEIAKGDRDRLLQLAEDVPWLGMDILPATEWRLPLAEDELLLARAWLWDNSYYKKNSVDNSEAATYAFQLNTLAISRLLYTDTLRGIGKKPQFEEMKLYPVERYATECRPVPVSDRTNDTAMDVSFNRYVGVLSALHVIGEDGITVPTSALDVLGDKSFFDSLNIRRSGRFKSLPVEVVFQVLRDAVEFVFEYGEAIVLATVKVLSPENRQANISEGKAPTLQPLSAEEREFLGVRYWSVTWYLNCVANNPKMRKSHSRVAPDIHGRIRDNEGLRELLMVLYGAVQVIVGVLMARRQSEIMGLVAGRCIDKTGEWLVFENRKSGIGGYRKTEARPIPRVAVKAIRLLERLQFELLSCGLIAELGSIFSYPKVDGSGVVQLVAATYNRAFDYFCDYSETKVDDSGRRYYIRQHQLRRFFAMVFFWGRGFGGLDTLRWFLGHSDAEHLYNYITESTPGEILNAVKAQYATDLVVRGDVAAEALADVLETRFGTRNFSVLDADEVEEYLEYLLNRGMVSVEPVFIQSPDGQQYRIIIKVTSLGVSDDE